MNEPDDELDVLIRHAEATQTGWKMVHASDLRTIHAKRASLTARLARVEAENKRMREALEFYARADTWTYGEDMDGNTWAYEDGGAKARAALARGGAK